MSKYTPTKLACYLGYVVQAVVNNFLPILFIALQDVYGLGYEKLGRLVVVNFITQMITDIMTPKIISLMGYRRATVMCQASAAFGLAMLAVLPRIMSDAYIAIALSIVIYAFGSGLMEVIMSPIIEMLPTENKSGNMSVLHSFYCWGQAFTVIVTTLLIKLFGYEGWSNVPLLWAILPFINMFFFFKVPLVEPEKDEKKATIGELIRSRRFRLYMVMMLCAGASEIAMAEWVSMFAQQALGVSKLVGDLAGPCAFAVLMGAGRIWYAAVSHKISFNKALLVMSVCCFVCYAMVAVCKLPLVSLLFCALCGFTVSVSWPGTYSAGAEDFTEGASVMYSVFAMCGDLGCCLGPWILGLVADRLGLNIGFAVTSVFPLIMIAAIIAQIKNGDCKKRRIEL